MSAANVRAALRQYLLADAPIAAIVGTRVYPSRMPQGEVRTSIVYTRVSEVGDHHLSGPSGLTRTRVQIDSWAQTIDAAVALADAVKECLDGFRGSVQWDENSPGNAVTVQGVFFDGSRDLYDDASKLNRVSQDYIIAYEER